jgi:hypothetical protein
MSRLFGLLQQLTSVYVCVCVCVVLLIRLLRERGRQNTLVRSNENLDCRKFISAENRIFAK